MQTQPLVLGGYAFLKYLVACLHGLVVELAADWAAVACFGDPAGRTIIYLTDSANFVSFGASLLVIGPRLRRLSPYHLHGQSPAVRHASTWPGGRCLWLLYFGGRDLRKQVIWLTYYAALTSHYAPVTP
jgi:hypothetical protein